MYRLFLKREKVRLRTISIFKILKPNGRFEVLTNDLNIWLVQVDVIFTRNKLCCGAMCCLNTKPAVSLFGFFFDKKLSYTLISIIIVQSAELQYSRNLLNQVRKPFVYIGFLFLNLDSFHIGNYVFFIWIIVFLNLI